MLCQDEPDVGEKEKKMKKMKKSSLSGIERGNHDGIESHN